jgi:hypothetical protein
MSNNILKYRISPEVLKTDIFEETYNGVNFGVYSSMTEIVSGGTNGDSYLTGLTIPIILSQTYNDIGYYSEFDGLIEQKDVIGNFVISGDPQNPYNVTVYNSSAYVFSNYLQLGNYTIDWGDGSVSGQLSTTNGQQSHTYQTSSSSYTITLSQLNPFGLTTISRSVYLPFTGVTIDNQLGEVFFTQQGGSWSGIPLSYNYIFTGDSVTDAQYHVSSNYTQVPFNLFGKTKSKLKLLKLWGPQDYIPGFFVQISDNSIGVVDEIENDYIAYTIDGIHYIDYFSGTTFFSVLSSGYTINDLSSSGLTKDELLLDFVMAPEVQTDVFVERGKYSPFEYIQRLGEVDNVGDLQRYGYGFFKINNT